MGCCSLENRVRGVAGYFMMSAIMGTIRTITKSSERDIVSNLVASIVSFLLGVLLLAGLKKNNQGMILAWMIIQGALTAVAAGMFCYVTYLLVELNDDVAEEEKGRELDSKVRDLIDTTRMECGIMMGALALHVVISIACMVTVANYLGTMKVRNVVLRDAERGKVGDVVVRAV